MKNLQLFTIGYTQKSAETFFGLLERAGVKRIIDIRLNNSSQLAGFTKKDDLKFFLKRIADIDYLHMTQLAPTQDILDDYKKRNHSWLDYEKKFNAVLKSRNIKEDLTDTLLERACLLCSEPNPDRCHRRLVAEFIKQIFPNLTIAHLG